jgi:tRNA threonylcarbamoyladenosine biosynthesis protein TsaB
MKLLALETATETCSVALLVDGRVVARRFELAPRRHAELILPMCESVLTETGLSLDELDALAFGRGPGAFTGVRLAISTAQGIGFAAELPLIPVSTLAALAHGVCRLHGAVRVAAALDARMGQVYWGCYEVDESRGLRSLGTEQVAAPDAVMAPESVDWFGAGSGWARHPEALGRRLAVRDCWPETHPDALDVALLAAYAWRRGEVVSPERAEPVYLRDQVAVIPSRG